MDSSEMKVEYEHTSITIQDLHNQLNDLEKRFEEINKKLDNGEKMLKEIAEILDKVMKPRIDIKIGQNGGRD